MSVREIKPQPVLSDQYIYVTVACGDLGVKKYMNNDMGQEVLFIEVSSFQISQIGRVPLN